jgi:release factor glutamine methyltransferase
MTAVVMRRLAAIVDPATARTEARWLVEAAGDDRERLEHLIARRMTGEPVTRVIGRRGFWTLDLTVTADVLDPRPDTETVVMAACDHARRRHGHHATLRILDLGTGSGAILLALLAEWPQASGIGIDLSQDALLVAQQNAVRTGLVDRAAFRQGTWEAARGERFDLVVSNPPYIPTGDLAGLDAAVREHDPRLALDGGPDGLDAYRAILPLLSGLLAIDGVAVFEIGHGQHESMPALAQAAGLSVVEIRPDLGGVPRAVVLASRD